MDLALLPVVAERLKVPQGRELSKMNALWVNRDISISVRVPSSSRVDAADLKLMRLVCEQFSRGMFWNTLAVIEFRMEKIHRGHRSGFGVARQDTEIAQPDISLSD